MTRQVLAIDDELDWRENFRSWIPASVADVQVAGTTREAVTCLRQRHYDVVLLDLAMTTQDATSRGNSEIQDYLSTRPEGTLYIVVSGTIEKLEVRDVAFRKNANNLIFKEEADPDSLVEVLLAAFETIGDPVPRFIAEAKHKLIGGVAFETQLISVLRTDGAAGVSRLLEAAFRRLAPVAQHRFRPQMTIEEQSVLGVLWSRQLGCAVSLTLANEAVSHEQTMADLARWLGYDEREVLFEKLYHHSVRVQIAREPSLGDELFELPIIGDSAGS